MSAATPVMAATDTAPPTVRFMDIPEVITISGSLLRVSVDAQDDSGIASVRYTLEDGHELATFTAPPYAFLWDLSSVVPGVHQVTATATDAAGNSAAAVLRVTTQPGQLFQPQLSDAPITVPRPVPALQNEAPSGRVLGVETTIPTISTVKSGNGAMRSTVGNVTRVLRPYGHGYTGALFAKRVDFGADGVVFLAAPKEATRKGEVLLYNEDGRVVDRARPSSALTQEGLHASITVFANTVYLAVGERRGTSSAIYTVDTRGMHRVQTMTPLGASRKGALLVRFLRAYRNGDIGLALIARRGRTNTVRMYKYAAAQGRWVEDYSYNLATLRVVNGTIVLRPVAVRQ